MLSLGVKEGTEIRITHKGEDLYLIFSKKSGRLRVGFIGKDSFEVKRVPKSQRPILPPEPVKRERPPSPPVEPPQRETPKPKKKEFVIRRRSE